MGEASITSASRMREKERGITVCRLADSFKTNSYNNVPPVIMELMKDMKGFSDIISKIVRFLIPIDGSSLPRRFISLERS